MEQFDLVYDVEGTQLRDVLNLPCGCKIKRYFAPCGYQINEVIAKEGCPIHDTYDDVPF